MHQLHSPPNRILYRDDKFSLILRPLEENDAKAVHDAVELSKQNLLKFMDWAHFKITLDEQRERILKTRESYFKGEDYEMGVFDSQTGAFMMGSGWHRGISLNKRSLAMGFWTSDQYRNRGLATLVTKILIVVAFEFMNCDRMEVQCNKENEYSKRVIKNCGFHLENESLNFITEPTDEMIKNGYSNERTFLQYSLLPKDRERLSWYSNVRDKVKVEFSG